MQDSLMNIKSCLLTINPIAYLTKNRIVVKDFVLEQPEIYAYVDVYKRQLIRTANIIKQNGNIKLCSRCVSYNLIC